MFTLIKFCIGMAAFLLLCTSIAYSIVSHLQGSGFFLFLGLLMSVVFASFSPEDISDV